jgi:hypothetical protein
MTSKHVLPVMVVLFIVLAGFTHAPSQHRSSATNNSAWISSPYEFRACPGQTYYAVGLQPGDVIGWYVDYDNPSYPSQYLGSSTVLEWELEPYDKITLKVNEGTEGEYEYYEYAQPCE